MVDKISCKNRRSELKELIAKDGVWNINKQEMGRRYGVSGVQIARDIEAILKDVPEESVQSIVSSLEPYFRRAIRRANEVMESSNQGLQIKGVQALTNAISQYTEFLESWGRKHKVADEVNLHTPPTFIITHSCLDVEAFLKWCEMNKKSFVVKIYERFKKLKLDEELREREKEKDDQLLKKPLTELVPEPPPVTPPMKVIIDNVGKGETTVSTEEEKPCGCGDAEGSYLCGFCGGGVRHPNGTICWKRVTSGKGVRIEPESHPRTAGVKESGNG